ncbi:MAG: AbrB/MazE/SpoVT family DNA-binding domain-containing protein [Candidatus Omnitrophica bacterium]|nr:AbrB/MazE/SpoVT family DNA-binding domain-containing protein [Candidatus Omnitrophota bacterium]
MSILKIMAKVTSKLQLTLPKSLAEECHIQPGDRVRCERVGDSILLSAETSRASEDIRTRLEIFDHAADRRRKRARVGRKAPPKDRGWTREDLYHRGGSR